MKKLATVSEIRFLLFLSSASFVWLIATVLGLSTALVDAKQIIGGTPMHKVQLTQKGYIQFLKWDLPVPEIHEFTFCLWMKSDDLKHPHSIFSYSKNERERLIRSWISSRGRSIHLEINGAEVFAKPIGIREQRWYHICQSLENRLGRYALWVDGHLELQGQNEEMIDRVIPGSGDIVLGQEYTDFDKGLEEGIEGSVLGFNFLLASAFDSLDYQKIPFQPTVAVINPARRPTVPKFPTEITKHNADLGESFALDGLVSNRFAVLGPNWSRKVFRSDGTRALESASSLSPSLLRLLNIANSTRNEEAPAIREKRGDGIAFDARYSTGEINGLGKSSGAPLGLQLVKLSYVHCQLGRGSPPIGDSLMLISWSRTPVKVFGGATIKNVGNECGNF